jgi:hypothetical protein
MMRDVQLQFIKLKISAATYKECLSENHAGVSPQIKELPLTDTM